MNYIIPSKTMVSLLPQRITNDVIPNQNNGLSTPTKNNELYYSQQDYGLSTPTKNNERCYSQQDYGLSAPTKNNVLYYSTLFPQRKTNYVIPINNIGLYNHTIKKRTIIYYSHKAIVPYTPH